LFKNIKDMHNIGLQTILTVCDAASINIKMLKAVTHGLSGRFSAHDMKRTWIPHPYTAPRSPLRKLHFLLCPPHLLKCLVNQLYASDEKRAKNFIYPSGESLDAFTNGIDFVEPVSCIPMTKFGWDSIVQVRIYNVHLVQDLVTVLGS
jgi:hypothetical protein